jgi:23S rRNA (guanine2445-N2)-methyltransferase / 23S rRNA (guanine2069-N7)-methyltransferase
LRWLGASATNAAVRFTVVVARGLEAALGAELRALKAVNAVEQGRAIVTFEGDLEAAYRVCMFARTASRVLLPLHRFATGEPDALYAGVQAVPWHEHLHPDGRLWVECVAAAGVQAHTRYLAQKTKDAVCDQLRERAGTRPNVDRDDPDVRIHLHVGRDETTVSLVLSGASMHRRGYRQRGGEAPLKETLAAGLLTLAGFPERAARGAPLVDPLCGSGTLLVEAALMARDIAPGSLRPTVATQRWLGHDASALARVQAEARERAARGQAHRAHVYGFDASEQAVRASREAVRRAGVAEVVRVQRRELADVTAPADLPPGLVVTNPPYGERLGTQSELMPLYEQLGDVLRRGFVGYGACVLTGSAVLAKSLGLRAAKRDVVFNGPLECRLLHLPIDATPPRSDARPGWRRPSKDADAYANRLRKNLRVLGKWAAREGIECYRLYDADIPEYNVAVDRYGPRVVVQEYAPPRSIPAADAARRLRDALLVTAEVLEVPRESIVLKVRRRQVQGAQYQRRGGEVADVHVTEGGLRFIVRLDAHIDTGLFAEQRLLRARIAAVAKDRSVLNLFAYTCTASVYAAAAGARRVTSVDLSSRYLAWGRDNFALNELQGVDARFVESDCASYLRSTRERFDVVLLNPPTYSRSHRVEGDFEVQRDHAQLVRAAVRCLNPGGELFFATHARNFELDRSLREELSVEDITNRIRSRDFARQPLNAYRLTRTNE